MYWSLYFYGSLAESYDYDIGSVAESDIYAPRTFVDSYETEHQAVIARNSVSAIFIRSDEISEENSDNVEGFFDLVSQEIDLFCKPHNNISNYVRTGCF